LARVSGYRNDPTSAVVEINLPVMCTFLNDAAVKIVLAPYITTWKNKGWTVRQRHGYYLRISYSTPDPVTEVVRAVKEAMTKAGAETSLLRFVRTHVRISLHARLSRQNGTEVTTNEEDRADP